MIIQLKWITKLISQKFASVNFICTISAGSKVQRETKLLAQQRQHAITDGEVESKLQPSSVAACSRLFEKFQPKSFNLKLIANRIALNVSQ